MPMVLTREALDAVSIPKSAFQKDGRVRIWSIPSGRWKDIASIDAREYVVSGVGNFDGPTVAEETPAVTAPAVEAREPQIDVVLTTEPRPAERRREKGMIRGSGN